jgi:hypothetical protein
MKPALTLYALDEVAERFRVSRRTMIGFVCRHPFYRLIEKRKLFTEADIKALYEALSRPSSSSAAADAPTGTKRGWTADDKLSSGTSV